jgi:hypothetical protein
MRKKEKQDPKLIKFNLPLRKARSKSPKHDGVQITQTGRAFEMLTTVLRTIPSGSYSKAWNLRTSNIFI